MKTVGVIGLGNMGMGIAKNLLKAGFTTRGYDLFEAKREELRVTVAYRAPLRQKSVMARKSYSLWL